MQCRKGVRCYVSLGEFVGLAVRGYTYIRAASIAVPVSPRQPTSEGVVRKKFNEQKKLRAPSTAAVCF
jgi:hypothetical protein